MAEHLVLKPNEVYSRPQIHSLIGGQQLGPISTPSAFRLILLFLETEKDTCLHSAGVWNFNGEANDEGTTMSRNNRMVVEHNSKGKYLLVFVLKPNQTHEREYLFIGVAVYRSHTIERGVVVFSMQMLEDLAESERRKFLLGESDQDQSGGAVVLLPDGGVSITLYKTKYFKVSREDFGIPKVDKKTKKKTTTTQNEPTVSKEEVEACFERMDDAQNQPNNKISFQEKSPTETINTISTPSNETNHNAEEIKVHPLEIETKSENVDKQSEKKIQEKREDKEKKKKKKRRKIVLEGDKGEEIQASSSSTLGSPFIQIVNGEIVFPTVPTPPPTTLHQKEKSIPRGARCLGKSNKFVGQTGRFIYDPEKDKKKSKGGGPKEKEQRGPKEKEGKKKVGDKIR